MEKSCKNCNGYKSLYTRYYSLFWRVNLHCCAVCGQIAKPEDCCDKWTKKKKEYDLSPERFDKAEEDIKRIIELYDFCG